MSDSALPLETLLQKAEDYSLTAVKLFKLKATDKSAEVISSLAVRLTMVLVIALFTLVLSFALSFWIGEMLGKTYYGFFAIAGVYAFVILVILTFKNSWIKRPVRNSIINQLLIQKK